MSLFNAIIMSCQPNSESRKKTNDNYHGVNIADDYRYMEDLENPEVLNWLKKQNRIAENSFRKLSGLEKLLGVQESLSGRGISEVTELKYTRDKKLFYLKRSSMEDQPKLYIREGINGKERLIFDPADQANRDRYINYFEPTWDGTKVVIGLSERGKEFAELQVFDVENNVLLPIKIKKALPSYGGVYWLPDNSGVIYIRVPIAENTKDAYLDMEMMIQKLDEKESKVLFSRKNNPKIQMKPEDLPIVFNDSYDKNYLYGAISGATIYQDYYYSLLNSKEKGNLIWTKLFNKEDKVTLFYRDNDNMVFLTSKDASNFKICSKSISNPKNVKTIVKEKKEEVITSFRLIEKGLVYTTTKNGVETKVYLMDKEGNTEELNLPFPAGKIVLKTKGNQSDFLSIIAEGWLNKKQRYLYDFSNNKFKLYDIQKYSNDIGIEDITVEEIVIPSYDGAKVPLSLIYNRNLKRDGTNSTFITAYGAYGTSIKPRFSKKIMTWVKEGGIYAIAHVRGGGEKGDAWYKGGLKNTKPNTWKDLIASTEYLIKNKYTSSDKVVINGSSAGGIAVGRAMTERPDLFKAVILNVGCLNALRTETGYNGENNIKEFGSVKDSLGFRNLLAMDSYYHIKKGVSYPATLVTTGINDSRVPPWHSAKFVAKLLECNSSKNPVLLSIDSNGGHGFNTSKKKKEEKVAQALSFAFWQTGHPDYQLKE